MRPHARQKPTARPSIQASIATILTLIVCLSVGGLWTRRTFAQLPATAPIPASESSITRRDLRASLEFLASDALAGRGVGHPGNDSAVRYIESAVERFGLKPFEPEGFLQPLPLVTSSLGLKNGLEVISDGNQVEHRWPAGDDFYPAVGSPSGDLSAQVAYAGLGTGDSDSTIDDYTDVDVKNRIVVVLEEHYERPGKYTADGRRPAVGPLDAPGRLAARARVAAAHGAVALVVVSRDRRLPSFGYTWPDAPSVRRRVYRLEDERPPIPVALVGAATGTTLLDLDRPGSATRSVASLYDSHTRQLNVPSQLVHMQIDVTTTSLTTYNVLALVEGRDPEHDAETVIVAAHLDHDGIDDDGQIYNGADDDGSGTVAVLEVAEAFALAARSGQRPSRSVLFAFWNAEEKGLLGSRYFVAHSAQHTVADLNLDMVGRHEEVPDANDPRFRGLPVRRESDSRSLVHILGYSFSPDLARVIKQESSHSGLRVATDYDTNTIDLLRRSDHWPFLLAGIPAMFLTTGLHPDYHTPRDDVGQIDFDKLERIARMSFRVAWRVANTDALPRFAAASTLEP